jgi:predicted transcriptional regulator
MEKSEVIGCLAALAQETRLDIVRYLVRMGQDGAIAGRIGQELGISSATLAFHLNILTAARMLIRQKNGRQNIYRANISAVHSLSAYLLENCCAGPDVDLETDNTSSVA